MYEACALYPFCEPLVVAEGASRSFREITTPGSEARTVAVEVVADFRQKFCLDNDDIRLLPVRAVCSACPRKVLLENQKEPRIEVPFDT